MPFLVNVNTIYQFSLRLIKKNQAGGLSASDFQLHWNDAQSGFMDDMTGRFQRNSYTKEGINTGLIENEAIITHLTPFIKNIALPIVGGLATIPVDMKYLMALLINDNKVSYINPDQIYSAVGSVIDPPSIQENTYYYTHTGDNVSSNQYRFLPDSVSNANIHYISTPKEIVWGFVLDSQNRQIYDAGSSIQPQWNDNDCREITRRMLKNLGVAYKDSDFASFGQSTIQSGV